MALTPDSDLVQPVAGRARPARARPLGPRPLNDPPLAWALPIAPTLRAAAATASGTAFSVR